MTTKGDSATMQKKRYISLAIFFISFLALPVGAMAEEAQDRGREIALEADRRDQGFGDFTGELTMVLRDRQGREVERALRSRNLEVEDDGDKTMIIFDSPPDVEGTALLVHSHKTGDDDLWLYLPALKRVKRISGSNKSGPFMGSEFAYEDLSSVEVEKYRHRFLREDELDGEAVYVVERIPLDERSGYTKQVVFFDRDDYRTLRVDYFDRKGELLKTLRQRDYELYLEKFWRPHVLEMVNHQTGKESELRWSGLEFQTGLTERDLDQASLRRVR